MLGLDTPSEKREPRWEPDASACAQQQRPSEGAPVITGEATVQCAEGAVLRSDGSRRHFQRGSSLGGSPNTGPEKREPRGTRGKRLPPKYLAGLLDADGSIYIHDPCRGHKSYVAFSFSNKRRDFVELVASSLTPPSAATPWGSISGSDDHGWQWRVVGQRAVNVLVFLRKYLVAHRRIAEAAEALNGLPFAAAREQLDALRNNPPPMPKHPTVKWTAGYIDGNGCFVASISANGSAVAYLVVSAATWKRVAIDLLQKQFGGSITEFDGKVEWRLSISPSKLRAFMEKDRIGQSLYLTTDRAYFLLKCARMGHNRDGIMICAGLDDMKTQPHRLSGPGAVVEEWIARVRNITDRRKRQSDAA